MTRKAVKRNADPEKTDLNTQREIFDTDHFSETIFFFKDRAKKVRTELIIIL